MARNSRFASAARGHVYEKFVGGDKDHAATYEEKVANAVVGWQIYDLRTNAGLTQDELAKLVGTTASVIGRLEDADYHKHSLAILRRVAEALC